MQARKSRISTLQKQTSVRSVAPFTDGSNRTFATSITKVGYGRTLMKTAARTVLCSEIHLSNNYLGLDEIAEERKEDYRDVRLLNRSRGYLGRKKLFMQTAI
jgi:hypothetical protein